MKRRITILALSLLVAATATGCPQKPNPFCPDNTCAKAPTTSGR